MTKGIYATSEVKLANGVTQGIGVSCPDASMSDKAGAEADLRAFAKESNVEIIEGTVAVGEMDENASFNYV